MGGSPQPPAAQSPSLSPGTPVGAARGPSSKPPYPSPPPPLGLGPGGCLQKFPRAAHARHRTYPATERDASSLRLQELRGVGGPGGAPPATQQQPRLRAVAGVPSPCAPRAARRPTLHKGSMALPRLAGSPSRRRSGSGPEVPASSQPHPAPAAPNPGNTPPSRPGPTPAAPRPRAPRTEPSAPAAEARPVTLASRAAIYIHAIGFHS